MEAVAEKTLFDLANDQRLSTNDSLDPALVGAFNQMALCSKSLGVRVGAKWIIETLRDFADVDADTIELVMKKMAVIIRTFKYGGQKKTVRTKSGNKYEYRLNNNDSSELAEMFEERFPEHAGYFERRSAE